MTRTLAAALGTALLAAVAAAQSTATIGGRVVDKSTKAGIAGAEILLVPQARILASDAGGFFRFERVAPGTVSLVAKRLGFAPESASFPVQANDDLEVLIELEIAAQPLDTVNVEAREIPLARGKLAGFYERKRLDIGKFIDADALEKEKLSRLGEVIVLHTPGSKLVRSRIGFISWVATNRDAGQRPTGAAMDPIDRRLGADPTACYPDVYLDGIKVYTFGFGNRLFDINSIATTEVAAVEFYVGTARIPPQFNSSSSACGVLLIWTK